MSRHLYFLVLLSLTAAASASQQNVKILVIDTFAGRGTLTSPSDSGSIISIPCGVPVPAESDPPPREPGQAVPVCTYGNSGIASSPFRFTRTNAILTTENGWTYKIPLYCQRQLSDCPELAEGETYTRRMNKKASLDASPSVPVWEPPKVDLRPDGRYKVSYTISYPQRLGSPPHNSDFGSAFRRAEGEGSPKR
jgi:hypothetical protein